MQRKKYIVKVDKFSKVLQKSFFLLGTLTFFIRHVIYYVSLIFHKARNDQFFSLCRCACLHRQRKKCAQKLDDEMINGHLRLAKVTFRPALKYKEEENRKGECPWAVGCGPWAIGAHALHLFRGRSESCPAHLFVCLSIYS